MALEQMKHQNKMAQNEIKNKEENIANMDRQLQDMRHMHTGARDEVRIHRFTTSHQAKILWLCLPLAKGLPGIFFCGRAYFMLLGICRLHSLGRNFVFIWYGQHFFTKVLGNKGIVIFLKNKDQRACLAVNLLAWNWKHWPLACGPVIISSVAFILLPITNLHVCTQCTCITKMCEFECM